MTREIKVNLSHVNVPNENILGNAVTAHANKNG